MDKFFHIGCMLALTVYGQLIIKARSLVHADVAATNGKSRYGAAMFTDVGVLSGLGAAVVAGIFGTLAVEKTGLGLADPFMALSFILVPLVASPLFNAPLTSVKLFGLGLIVIGVTISSLAR